MIPCAGLPKVPLMVCGANKLPPIGVINKQKTQN